MIFLNALLYTNPVREMNKSEELYNEVTQWWIHRNRLEEVTRAVSARQQNATPPTTKETLMQGIAKGQRHADNQDDPQ